MQRRRLRIHLIRLAFPAPDRTLNAADFGAELEAERNRIGIRLMAAGAAAKLERSTRLGEIVECQVRAENHRTTHGNCEHWSWNTTPDILFQLAMTLAARAALKLSAPNLVRGQHPDHPRASPDGTATRSKTNHCECHQTSKPTLVER
jgi:hypothetical protein